MLQVIISFFTSIC